MLGHGGNLNESGNLSNSREEFNCLQEIVRTIRAGSRDLAGSLQSFEHCTSR